MLIPEDTMTETTDLPLWHAREDLDVHYLANALEHIRRSAYLHWFGDAFDPEHMHAISALAAQALCGEPIDSPVDMNSPQWRDRVRGRSQEWMDLCDGAVVEQAGCNEAAATINNDLEDSSE